MATNEQGKKLYGYDHSSKVRAGQKKAAPLEPSAVIVDMRSLGFDTSADPFEAAEQFERTPEAGTLRDFAKGGLKLFHHPALPEETVEALGMTGIPTEYANGHKGEKIKDATHLAEVAGEKIHVTDTTGALSSVAEDSVLRGLLVAGEAPESPFIQKRVSIEANQDGASLIGRVNGKASGSFDLTRPRVQKDMLDWVGRIKADPSSLGEALRVKMPDTKDGTTTLAAEAAYLRGYREYVMKGYKPPVGSTPDAILQILLAHHEESVDVAKQHRDQMRGAIVPFTRNNEPVPISLTYALGLRAPNPLKFNEVENVPHYGWAHFANFIKLMDEKVRTVHPAGIEVTVFEEATLFGKRLGFSDAEVAQALKASDIITKAIEAPIKKINLTPDMFPADQTEKEHDVATDDRVYAIICSQEFMDMPDVMDPLYTDRQNRSYAAIRERVSRERWDEAKAIAESMGRQLAWRKRVGLFDQLVGGKPFAIDATVTDKSGRIVLDVTSPAMFNHGMPVVRRAENGLHRVQIEPEYRVAKKHPDARPVKIDYTELGIDKPGKTTFLYESK